MVKKFMMIAVILILLGTSFAEEKQILEHLNKVTFKEKVFDFETETEWKYKGELPAIIDFYADWCGPCRKIAPIMIELSEEYKDKIVIYKVDTQVEQELAGMFGIRSIPAVLFIPKDGKPQMTTGAMQKEDYKKLISEILSVE